MPRRPTTHARRRAVQALRAFVRGADDRRLERAFGTRPALRALFRAAEAAYVPAPDVAGELAFALRTTGGAARPWVLVLGPDRARARAGTATAPLLTLRLGIGDLVRIAAGELDADAALLEGRLDLEGDFALALRLGALFGR